MVQKAARLGKLPPYLFVTIRNKIREARAAGWECDVRKAIEELDWKPAASLAERLRQTIAWYRHHGWLR